MKTQVKFGGLAAISVLLVSSLLVSCSTTSSPSSETSSVVVKPYGSLAITGSWGGNGVLDPQIATANSFQAIGAAVFDSLIDLTPDAQPKPGIAERWEMAPDGMTHTFYIRKGVKFHDGSDLTGADVRFSMERILAPEATHTDSAVWRGQVAKVELKDDYTVVVYFKQPQFELLKGFADFGGTAAVVPKQYIQEKGVDYFRKNPVGSGPFRVLKYEANNRLELESVENHWRAVPKFKYIAFLSVREEGTRMSMLKTGELDIANIAPDSVPAAKAAGLRILSWDGGTVLSPYLFYDVDNSSKYTFGDVRVRKAMSLAINRRELADKIFGGYGEPSAMPYVPRTAYFFDPNVLKPDPYDPEGAKKLLAEAGRPNGFDIRVYDRGAGNIESTATIALSGYWRKIGVNATVAPIQSATVLAMFYPKHKPDIWDAVYTPIGGGGAVGHENMVKLFHPTKGTIKNIKNPKLEELFDKIPTTKDPAEKKRIALEAAIMAKNEYAILGVVDTYEILALGPKVGDLVPIKEFPYYSSSFESITHAK